MRLDKKRYTTIAASKLMLNDGQLGGVPSNPRFIKDEKFEALKKSLSESPELLKARPLIVFPVDDKFIVLCGNMRLRAGKALNFEDFPCYVLPDSTTPKKLREYVLKDNMEYGQIDWEHITQDWDKEELADWDFDLPDDWDFNDPTLEDEEEPMPDELTAEDKNKPFVIKIVCEDEKQLNEFKADIDALIADKYPSANYSVTGGEL